MSANQLFLFQVEETQMSLISLKVNNEDIDITTAEGYAWLQKNYMDDTVEFFTSEKAFSKDKHQDIFGIIKQGAVMTRGNLYQFFERFVG